MAEEIEGNVQKLGRRKSCDSITFQFPNYALFISLRLEVTDFEALKRLRVADYAKGDETFDPLSAALWRTLLYSREPFSAQFGPLCH